MIKVEVTQEDIDNGPKFIDSMKCPVAMALKRVFNLDTSVGGTNFCFYNENGVSNGNYYQLPIEAVRFILDYDGHREVKPFTFEIDGLIDMTFARVD